MSLEPVLVALVFEDLDCSPDHLLLFTGLYFHPNIYIGISFLCKSILEEIPASLVEKVVNDADLELLQNPLRNVVASIGVEPGRDRVQSVASDLALTVLMEEQHP